MPTWSLSDTARIVFKIVLFSSFVLALGTFSVWFVGFMNSVYSTITTNIANYSSSSLPGLAGCALHALGIDDFLSSAFAIFFSAASFWLIAVGYILTYKLGLKAYDGLFKALT